MRNLILGTIEFSFSVLQAGEWYEEGEGGYSVSNGNIVPANSSAYQNTNSVTYRLADADGVNSVADGDLLGAFYDGELRGIASSFDIGFGDYAGEKFFLLYMYSNTSGSEEFTFKFYDASEAAVSDVPETYVFVADTPLGSMVAPMSLTYVAPSGGGDTGGGSTGNGYVDTSGWNQEGVGGYATSNGNVVPENSSEFQNTNSVTYRLTDDGTNPVADGDFFVTGNFYVEPDSNSTFKLSNPKPISGPPVR